MCCPLVFEFSVGIGGFVIGLGQISFFLSLIGDLTTSRRVFLTFDILFNTPSYLLLILNRVITLFVLVHRLLFIYRYSISQSMIFKDGPCECTNVVVKLLSCDTQGTPIKPYSFLLRNVLLLVDAFR